LMGKPFIAVYKVSTTQDHRKQSVDSPIERAYACLSNEGIERWRTEPTPNA